MKKYLRFVAISVFLLSCADDTRDNPYDMHAVNYIGNASVEDSSSSVEIDNEPSSSSVGGGQGSSSSSSVGGQGGGLCAGFVEGTEREHYGKMKKQFCDGRDGQIYVYVTIGEGETTQTWMAENLNHYECHENEVNCTMYGRLYDWAAAMKNSVSSSKNVQGVCPTGWHLPSKAEWEVLLTAVGGSNLAGAKLKAASGWELNSKIENLDTYGFSALPDSDNNFGFWWSASGYNSSDAYRLSLSYSRNSAILGNYSKLSLYYVRCVQN